MSRPDTALLAGLLGGTALLGAAALALGAAASSNSLAEAAYQTARTADDRGRAALQQLRLEAPRIRAAAARLQEMPPEYLGDEDALALAISRIAIEHHARDLELSLMPANAGMPPGAGQRTFSLQARFPHEGHFLQVLQDLGEAGGPLAATRHCVLEQDAQAGALVHCELSWLARALAPQGARR
ncbi:hypothetical protein [Niveibacterium sp. SC-1]|uniref:hypothetical protein n=1 Tax=Niveibacterium sp. SC-1 TaxID=3135646 RepID=UPI00311DA27A